MTVTEPGAQAHTDAGQIERAAAKRAARLAGTIRGRVLQLIADAGDAGLTAVEAYEIYKAIYGRPSGGFNSVSPRLSELKERWEYVEFGTVRGRRNAYVVNEVGRAALRGLAA